MIFFVQYGSKQRESSTPNAGTTPMNFMLFWNLFSFFVIYWCPYPTPTTTDVGIEGISVPLNSGKTGALELVSDPLAKPG